jgi:SAM-dependent methyltransferase
LVTAIPEPHLVPYLEAVAQHGGGFRSLLWASPKTQRARFAAITRAVNLDRRIILDAGCGRADLLGYLLKQGVQPAEYIGIEAVEELARAAEERRYERARIVRGDFVVEPLRFCMGAETIIFCGSLNTLRDPEFYATLRHAFMSTGEELVFNFLSSSALAGKLYLFWRSTADVERFARTLTSRVDVYEDYLNGDCTIALRKEQ